MTGVYYRTPMGKNGYERVSTLAVPVPYFSWQLDADVTVGHALVAATQRLKSAGLDTPRLDSEVLLSYVRRATRAQLYTDPDQILTDQQRHLFEQLVERRFRHEPVAYLVGEKGFYGLDLAVDRRVLIPRPETELLVDLALDVVSQTERLHQVTKGGNGRPATNQPGRVAVADVGTGSGAVALAIAANSHGAYVYAIDISDGALAVASSNAERHQLQDRVCLCQGDLLLPLPEPVDLIVANLPYVARHEWDDLAPDIAQFEPSLALMGGDDGLVLIRRLLEQAPSRLRPNGTILLEIGDSQGTAVAGLARHHFPNAFVAVLTDYGYRDRIVRIQT